MDAQKPAFRFHVSSLKRFKDLDHSEETMRRYFSLPLWLKMDCFKRQLPRNHALATLIVTKTGGYLPSCWTLYKAQTTTAAITGDGFDVKVTLFFHVSWWYCGSVVDQLWNPSHLNPLKSIMTVSVWLSRGRSLATNTVTKMQPYYNLEMLVSAAINRMITPRRKSDTNTSNRYEAIMDQVVDRSYDIYWSGARKRFNFGLFPEVRRWLVKHPPRAERS